MVKPLTSRIQHLADDVSNSLKFIEMQLISDQISADKIPDLELKLGIYAEMLRFIEELFEDVLYVEEK